MDRSKNNWPNAANWPGQLVRVKDKDLAAPPGAPADGDAYIVPPAGWGGLNANAYARYLGATSAWYYVAAVEGMIVWADDENLYYYFDGAAWAVLGSAIPFITISASIAASQNNYAPTGWAGADLVLLTLDNDSTITGFLALAAGAGPNVKYIVNVTPPGEESLVLRLARENAGSTAANRIYNAGGDVYLQNGQVAMLVRDNVGARWKVVTEPQVSLYGTAAYVLTANGAGVPATYQAPAPVPTLIGDSGAGGVAGLAPAPAAGDAALRKFLMASGSWDVVESGIQPAAIAAQANNYTPTGWAAATLAQIQLTGNQTLTGLGELTFGTVRRLHNVDATDTLSIAHNSGSSTNVNRISTFDGATALLMPGQVGTFISSATVTMGRCWILIDISGAGALIRAPQLLTAGATYVPPAGCKSFIVEPVGAGGGGGGAASAAVSAAAGGGGGAGGYARKRYVVDPALTYSTTFGAAGTAGANTGGDGGDGGDTTFTDGTTMVTANGGKGGKGDAGGTIAALMLGGDGGAVGTNGDLNASGAPGNIGGRLSGTLACSGSGGSGPFGGGGNARNVAGVGVAGTGNGSGGSGGNVTNGSAAVTGAVGTNGAMLITEFS